MSVFTIVTGIIKDEKTTSSIIDTYANVDNVYISTWESTPHEYVSKLKNNGFVCILSKSLPEGVYSKSVNNQLFTAQAGLNFINEFTNEETIVIRTRTDITFNDYRKFINIIVAGCSKNKVQCLTGVIERRKGIVPYIVDYIICGKKDTVSNFYDIPFQTNTDIRFPELYLLDNLLGVGNNNIDRIKKTHVFFIEQCAEMSIEILWDKFKPPKNIVTCFNPCKDAFV